LDVKTIGPAEYVDEAAENRAPDSCEVLTA
jgi:hypothetical protein